LPDKEHRTLPNIPNGSKNHHRAIRVPVEASSHVRLFFPGGGVLRVGYMAVGSILFLQEQIKDIIIIMLFIGTQFSNLYTAVDTPARGRVGVCVVFVCKYVLGRSRVSQPLNLRLCLLRHFGFLTSPHASPPCRGRRLNSYRLLRRSTPGPPPNLRAHRLHFPTSPRPPLYTPSITT